MEQVVRYESFRKASERNNKVDFVTVTAVWRVENELSSSDMIQ